MSEEQKHLIISIALWAIVIVTVIIGVFAISSSGIRGGFHAREVAASGVSSELAVVNIIPESTPEESAPLSSTSSEFASSSQTSSQANTQSSQVTSSRNTTSSVVDASAVATVTLYGGGQSVPLTEAQITEFMSLYNRVSISATATGADNSGTGNGVAGFTITYGDGRKEGYTLGVVYDGIWHSGSQSYSTGITAYDLEAYLCQYPVITNQLNQTPHSSSSSQQMTASSEQQAPTSSEQQATASSGQQVTASSAQQVTASSEQQTMESSTAQASE